MAHHFLFTFFWGLCTSIESSTFAADFEMYKTN